MTTSPGTEKPAERSAAEAQGARGSELSPRAATDGDAQETAPLTGSIAAPPADRHQLEAEIERTREQLGETVQELVARVDVKSRARAKAAELTGKARRVRGLLGDRTAAARQKAMSSGGSGKDQLRNRAAAVGAPVWEATPEQVRRAVTKGASGARERWVPLAVAAGVLIVGYVAIRHWSGRAGVAIAPESGLQIAAEECQIRPLVSN